MLTQPELSEIVGHLNGILQRLSSHLAPTVTPEDQLVPPEPVPFNPPYRNTTCPSGFQIPSGTYRGRRLSELDNDTLRNVYNGFKGCGKLDVADQIQNEINRRQCK
jgi:hypothetical protein